MIATAVNMLSSKPLPDADIVIEASDAPAIVKEKIQDNNHTLFSDYGSPAYLNVEASDTVAHKLTGKTSLTTLDVEASDTARHMLTGSKAPSSDSNGDPAYPLVFKGNYVCWSTEHHSFGHQVPLVEIFDPVTEALGSIQQQHAPQMPCTFFRGACLPADMCQQ